MTSDQLVYIGKRCGDPILERAVDFVLADEITHVRMGSKWLTPDRERSGAPPPASSETLVERFNHGAPRQLGDHKMVPISIATEARKLAGFTDEEIERLIKTTQRSQVY